MIMELSGNFLCFSIGDQVGLWHIPFHFFSNPNFQIYGLIFKNHKMGVTIDIEF